MHCIIKDASVSNMGHRTEGFGRHIVITPRDRKHPDGGGGEEQVALMISRLCLSKQA